MGGDSAPSKGRDLGEVLGHVHVRRVADLDGAEGVVGAKVEAGEGDGEAAAGGAGGGHVVHHVRGALGVAHGAAEAEAHAVVEVDELGAGELAGLVHEEEGQAVGGHRAGEGGLVFCGWGGRERQWRGG